MVTTNALGFKMIDLRILPTSRQCTLAASENMEINRNRPFYILVSNFSDREIWFSNHTKIAHTAEPLSSIRGIDTDDREAFPIRSLEADTNSKCNAPDDTIMSQHGDVSVVH